MPDRQPTLSRITMSGSSKRERLIANDVTGAPDRVSKAKRGLLTGKAGGARRRQHVLERFQLHRLAARPQGLLEFGLDIEMVFDDGFVATGDEHEVFDTGCHGLFDNILDHGLVDDSQHLLGHGLGCGKKSGPQPCNRQDGFSDFTCFRHLFSSFFINDLPGASRRFSASTHHLSGRGKRRDQGMEHGKRFVDGWGDRVVNQSPAIALNHRMLGT
jgi:hypothetical protein